MFKRVVLLAAWTGLCMYFPALAAVDPLVKPVIDKVHYQVPADSVSVAMPFYDGRHCPAEAVCERTEGDCQVAGSRDWRVFDEGFWCRGPVRRIVSAPIRWLFRL